MTDVENFSIHIEQKQYHKEEYEALKISYSINKDFSLFSYMTYLDENGLLRLGSKLEFSDLLIDEKYPIILLKNSWLTSLIARREHGKAMHGETASILSKVKFNY